MRCQLLRAGGVREEMDDRQADANSDPDIAVPLDFARSAELSRQMKRYTNQIIKRTKLLNGIKLQDFERLKTDYKYTVETIIKYHCTKLWWRARSRLYRSRFLQAHTHSARCV